MVYTKQINKRSEVILFTCHEPVNSVNFKCEIENKVWNRIEWNNRMNRFVIRTNRQQVQTKGSDHTESEPLVYVETDIASCSDSPVSSSNKTKKIRIFRPEWVITSSWIIYKEDKDVVFCCMCKSGVEKK